MELGGLIAGLGNPGPTYAGTRHNMGFMAAAELLLSLERAGSPPEELSGGKFRSLLWKIRLPGSPAPWLLAMPQTFMNLSGEAVQPLMAWYRIEPSRLVVVHDELDLEPGRLKWKFGGGTAGHNGLKSIAGRLGTQDFHRLRLGVGRPPAGGDVIAWVLGRFAPQDKSLADAMLPEAAEALMQFAVDGAEKTANRINGKRKK